MIFFAAGVEQYTKINYLVGAIVFSLSLMGVNGIGQEIAQDRLLGTLKWFVTSPIHPLSYVVGVLLPHILAGIINSFVILAIGKFLWGAPLSLSPILLLVFVLSILSLLGLGAVIGSYSKNPAQAYGLTNILSFVIIFLSPVYYPIDILPLPVRIVSYVLPTTYAAQALRSVLSGSFATVFESLIILSVMAAFLLILGVSKVKWREK
jgi:ABC-2 type transport system permease protein